MKKYLNSIEKLDVVLGCIAYQPKNLFKTYKNFYDIVDCLDQKEIAHYPEIKYDFR